ncbi:MAG: prephenate dehydrogenase [Dehalococcoidales bacterium]|nr:prephenate dehydrogenase [Dehalococcoidales bacterium]
MKIGIIGGAGKMGSWFARLLLKEGLEIILSDSNKDAAGKLQEQISAEVASSKMVVETADTIILCVNIDNFEEAVKEISPHVRPGQVIMDISSVKEYTVDLMHQYCEKAVILGTHPLFGPGAIDLSNQNFVLTPTSEQEDILARKVRLYLQKHGSRVTLMPPLQHDKMMSVVLGLSHFISIVAADTLIEIGNLPQLKAIGGSTYRVLITLVESVVSEDPELYASLQMRLPYLNDVEELFQMQAAKWADMVKNKDKQAFIKKMTSLKYRFASDNTNFGQAYENMYKIMEWL